MNSPILEFKPIIQHPSLVSDSVFRLAQAMIARIPDIQISVGEIDPQFMGGKELSEHYGIDPDQCANCVIVEAMRGENSQFVAIVIPVGYRADLNGVIRKHLNARKISLAPLDKVLQETGMEFGSITPFGLPDSWKILIDNALLSNEKIIVGGGKQISKLLLPTSVFSMLPNAEIIPGISKPIQ